MSKKENSSGEAQSLIEFALILPVLTLLIIGLFDLGTAVYTRNVIANAAREGARTGIILSKTDADIRARVQAAAPGLGLTPAQIQINPPYDASNPLNPRPFGSSITVTVSYTYTSITPVIGRIVGNGGRLALSATSVMAVENVIPY
jgi:Flp pilus assembly protein TadG